MRSVDFDPGRLAAAAKLVPPTQPIIMVNMLRFREQADYADRDDVEPCSGRDAYYKRYAPVSSPLVQEDGAEIFWLGKAIASLIAPDGEEWDDFILVKYPNIGALMRLFTKPAYQAVIFHRKAALDDSRFILTQTVDELG